MKKLIPLSIFTILLMSRCHFDPVADFSASTDLAEPYEVIYFNNFSTESTDYYWEFGDGQSSNDVSPEHFYVQEGSYTVRLTAKHRKGGSDIASMNIIIQNTALEVTVAKWNQDFVLDKLIPDAEVTLYTTYDDWYNLENKIETRITNSDGVAVFPHVESTIYYIDVYQPYYNNESLGLEDISYIETLSLDYAVYNTFTAWVDFVPPAIQQQNRSARVPYKMDQQKRTFKRFSVTK